MEQYILCCFYPYYINNVYLGCLKSVHANCHIAELAVIINCDNGILGPITVTLFQIPNYCNVQSQLSTRTPTLHIP